MKSDILPSKNTLQDVHTKLLLPMADALMNLEINGFKIDQSIVSELEINYLDKLDGIERQLRAYPEVANVEKKLGKQFNMDSPDQMRELMFSELGVSTEGVAKTDGGKFSTNKKVIEKLKDSHEVVQILNQHRKYSTLYKMYVKPIRGHISPDGKVHCSYQVNGTVTGRTCLAKGTMIDTIRDLSKQWDGVPIEEVKAGDLVYTYNDNLDLCIKRVVWAGKTGIKPIIRVHWVGQGGKFNGHIDITSNHLVRLVSGEYKKAGDLKKKDRVLALSRSIANEKYSRLHIVGNKEIREHRFVYEKLFGCMGKNHIHHKDGNHLNQFSYNLEKLSKEKHAKYHIQSLIDSGKFKLFTSDMIRKKWKEGKYKDVLPKGEQHSSYIKISKFGCFRMISKAGGRISKVTMDFGTFEKKLLEYNIDINKLLVRYRYGADGQFISRGRLFSLKEQSIAKVARILRVTEDTVWKLYKFYKIDRKRYWKNQYSQGLRNNHMITKVEFLNKVVEVYDIEVEDTHNFIANGICVHNSSERPNLQQIPKNIKDEKVGFEFDPDLNIKRMFIPSSKNHILLQADYCLSGDTEIETISGQKTIKHIVENIGKEKLYTYCYKLDENRIGVSEIIAGKMTGKQKEIWLVTLDNGKTIKATPEHKFMLRDKSYKMVKELVVGEGLMPFYKVNTKKDGVNYTKIYLNNGKTTQAHNLIALDIFDVNIQGNNGLVVHHKNGNGVDNKLENLQIMDRKEHMRIHAIQSWVTPKKKRDFKWVKSEIGRAFMSERAKGWWESLSEFQKELMGKQISKSCKNQKGENNGNFGNHHKEETRKLLSEQKMGNTYWLGKHHSKESIKKMKTRKVSKETRNLMSVAHTGKHLSDNTKEKISVAMLGSGNPNYGKRPSLETREKMKLVWKKRKERTFFNHKIVSVVFLGYEDVYNITVEGCHNFALEAGVIVKNSQQELRILCTYSQDENMLKAFLNGEDIHLATGSAMAGHTITKDSMWREIAKNINFGIVYGITPEGLAETAKISVVEARKFISDYFKRLPQVEAYIEEVKDFCRTNKYVTSMFGRVRRLRAVESPDKWVREAALRQASNMGIQSTASDYTQCSLINLIAMFKKFNLKSKITATVHDSIIFDVLKSELQTVIEIVNTVMLNPQNDLIYWSMETPLAVDFEIGERWSDLKGIVVNNQSN